LTDVLCLYVITLRGWETSNSFSFAGKTSNLPKLAF